MIVAVVRGSRDATAGLTLKYGASLKNSESQGLILRSAGAAHGLRPKDRKRINVPFRHRKRSSEHRPGSYRSKRSDSAYRAVLWPAARRFPCAIDRDLGTGAADPRPPPRRAPRGDCRLWRERPVLDAGMPHAVALFLNPYSFTPTQSRFRPDVASCGC
jgi:hypothetical protein